MEGVTTDFVGNGGMGRAALHNLLRAQALGNSTINATLGPIEFEGKGDQATLRFAVLLTGGNGRFLPDSAQTYYVTSGWRLENGQWRVYYAQWKSNP
jgi:hypothetical protein